MRTPIYNVYTSMSMYIYIYTYTHVLLVSLQYFFHIHHFYLQSFKALVLTSLEHDHSSFSDISTVRLVDPLPLLMWWVVKFVQGTRSWIFITTGCAVLFFFVGIRLFFRRLGCFVVVFVLVGKKNIRARQILGWPDFQGWANLGNFLKPTL